MKCRKIARNVRNVTSAFDRFQSDNPLLVRKKFQMKDVFFRKDHPEVELFRWEIAWDAELTLLMLLAAAVLLVMIGRAVCRRPSPKACGRRRERRQP